MSLNPAIKEAIDAGIAVVAIDAPVSAPGAYNLSNDQEQYAYLGAKWLFEQIGSKGAVVYMRGIPGHPADTDRDKGFKKALAENPDITIAKETVTNWDQTDRHRPDQRDPVAAAPSSTASGPRASTTSSSRRSRRPTTRRADRRRRQRGFVKQLLTEPGLKGAAVTNPPAVGGAGVVLGEQLLAGQKPADTNVHVTPELWDNTTPEGKAALTAAQIPSLPDIWPLGLTDQGLDDLRRGRRQRLQGPRRD